MPICDVQYIEKSGAVKSETAETENEGVLVEILRQAGMYPLKINPSKSQIATLDVQALAAENPSEKQLLSSLDDTVHQIRSRFEAGDDSAYEEMVTLARVVSEEPRYSEEVQNWWRQQLEGLEAAGNAEGLREGKGLPTARTKRIIVARGTLVDQSGSRTGAMIIVPNQGLAFTETENRDDAEIFVGFRDVEQIRKRGFFKMRMEIVDKGGQVFRFTLDRLRTPVPLQRMWSPERLWLICQIECGGFI